MIFDDFEPNSRSYRGVLLVAVKKGSNLEQLLERIGIPAKFSSRFKKIKRLEDNWPNPYEEIEFEDLIDNYWILEAGVYWDDVVDNELSGFIQLMSGTKKREKLIGDDLILLFCNDLLEGRAKKKEKRECFLIISLITGVLGAIIGAQTTYAWIWGALIGFVIGFFIPAFYYFFVFGGNP